MKQEENKICCFKNGYIFKRKNRHVMLIHSDKLDAYFLEISGIYDNKENKSVAHSSVTRFGKTINYNTIAVSKETLLMIAHVVAQTVSDENGGFIDFNKIFITINEKP